jgi:hypothetical protein
MAGIFLVNVLDVARALGSKPLLATSEQVANWLLGEYIRKRGGMFNYNTSIEATFDPFRGGLILRSSHSTLHDGGKSSGASSQL